MFNSEEIYEIGQSLDSAEAVLVSQNLAFERADGEIHFTASTTYTDVHGHFFMRDDGVSCTLSYIFEQKVPQQKRQDINSLIAILNETLWIGHFEVNSQTDNIAWRHAVPLIGRSEPEPQEIAALMAAGVEACERFYPALNFIIWAGKTPFEAAQAALFETRGEA